MHGNEIVNNHPIRVYDNGGKFDRYTVVFMDQKENELNHYACLGMDAKPFHPQGFGQHSIAMIGKHLGRRISFAELPEDCRKCVLQEWQ